jgi:hypothetical protein
MAVTFALPAAALDMPVEITDTSKTFGTAKGYILIPGMQKRTFKNGVDYLLNTGTLWPGTEIFVPLRSKDFQWNDSYGAPPLTLKTAQMLEMAVWRDDDRDFAAIKKLELAERDDDFGILLVMHDYYDFLDQQKFSLTAGIEVGGVLLENSKFTVSGAISNRRVRIDRDSKTVQLGAGLYAEGVDVQENNAVTLDLGGGVSILTQVEYNDKLYARIDKKQTAKDKTVMEKYAAITDVYHLTAISVKGKVSFDLPANTFIYDKDLNFLGTGGQGLKLTDTYYVSESKLS